MTTGEEWNEIRRLHAEEGVSKKELARRFGRDLKTIRRVLEGENPPARRRRKLDPFRDEVAGWLRDEPGLTAREAAARLRDLAGPVGDRTVRKFLAELRHDTDDTPPPAITPSQSDPLPAPDDEGRWDLASSRCFLNRELTWLNFNFRVLHEAVDERTPLLERVKFLAIVGSNLDEFIMKRIGGLKQQVGAGLHRLTLDGRTPQAQIDECSEVIRLLEERQRLAWEAIHAELLEAGIHVRDFGELDDEARAALRDQFLENIYPLVTPQSTDPAHPFPFISNLSLNLLVSLRSPKDQTPSLARVKVPVGAGTPRLVAVPGTREFVPLESILAHNLDLLFPGMEVESRAFFRVTRNANTELEEETADDLMDMIETELRERKFAPVVRLEVSPDMNPTYRGMLAAELGLDEQADVFETPGLLGMRDLMELVSIPEPELHDPPHHPVDHPALQTDRNIFHILRDAGSILLHHPYESFSTSVERFLREASRDPKVRAIKMTLYRTSADSKAIPYLIDAALNGKQVAVAVELKARFDEAANITWANRMEEVGIHVTYGVVGLKTHAKAILVVRQDYSGLRRYAHVGTGNYHAGTARIYSDHGLLTSDEGIGRDLTELFNYLTTGYKPRRNYRKLLVSPKTCKQGLLHRIAREIEHQQAGEPGLIQIKTNALEDGDMVRALYRAAQAGVRIDLLVRDTCRLRPGIEGLSESVRVISTVGRFLEHTRLYYFRNGGTEEYFLGSADCMRRNLESRVEVLAPVEDAELRGELRIFFDAQLHDRRGAWEMRPDGSYVQRRKKPGTDAPHAQQVLIDWVEKRNRKMTRLRRRRARGGDRRNVR